MTRSTPILIYDAINLTFKLIIYGYERLANYLGVHVNTAKRVAKSAISYTSPKGDNLIISLVELTDEDLKTIKANDKPRSTGARSVLLPTLPFGPCVLGLVWCIIKIEPYFLKLFLL